MTIISIEVFIIGLIIAFLMGGSLGVFAMCCLIVAKANVAKDNDEEGKDE